MLHCIRIRFKLDNGIKANNQLFLYNIYNKKMPRFKTQVLTLKIEAIFGILRELSIGFSGEICKSNFTVVQCNVVDSWMLWQRILETNLWCTGEKKWCIEKQSYFLRTNALWDSAFLATFSKSEVNGTHGCYLILSLSKNASGCQLASYFGYFNTHT